MKWVFLFPSHRGESRKTKSVAHLSVSSGPDAPALQLVATLCTQHTTAHGGCLHPTAEANTGRVRPPNCSPPEPCCSTKSRRPATQNWTYRLGCRALHGPMKPLRAEQQMHSSHVLFSAHVLPTVFVSQFSVPDSVLGTEFSSEANRDLCPREAQAEGRGHCPRVRQTERTPRADASSSCVLPGSKNRGRRPGSSGAQSGQPGLLSAGGRTLLLI